MMKFKLYFFHQNFGALMCFENSRYRRRVDTEDYEHRGSRRRNHRSVCLNYAEGYTVPVTTGDLDADAILRDSERRYTSYRTSSIFITTFNVNGRSPSLEGIPEWLSCGANLPPDFYVIGLQEMDSSAQAYLMNTSTRHTEWKVVIAKSFPENTDYDLIREVRLVGIFLAVYRRVGSKIKLRPTDIETALVPTGTETMVTARLGNKGAVAISMHMNDSTVCFVNAHFSAHEDCNEKRIEEYRYIVNMIRFGTNDKSIFDHDAIFWCGDLNFRLESNLGIRNDDFRKLCADDKAFRDMIIYDQLKRSMKLKYIFRDFREPTVLNFRPTYKYDVNTDNWDSSSKHRAPAWCDRILWWKQDGVHIRQKFYESVPEVKFSDHRPVRALFYMSVRKIDLAEYDKAYHRALKKARRRRLAYYYYEDENRNIA